MLVNSLETATFRNIESCHIQFSDAVNIFYGKNGSGKTNLLEAIFVLLLARSPRSAADQIMIRDSADFFRVTGDVEIEGMSHQIAVACQKGGRKRITIDKISVRASELFEKCTAVSTAPDDVELLGGPPAKRREFINIYLSQASQRYIADLSDYNKVLAQKNAFLRQENNLGETPYDDLLIKYGSSIIIARKAFLDEIGRNAAEHYNGISGGQKLSTVYKPSVRIDDGAIEDNFAEKLARYKERERAIQTCLVGPHRDEVEFFIRDFPARSHGSQGEIRTAAISLKLAVFDYLKAIRKVTPILLLDEIFAELDAERVGMLVELFGRFGQIFLTTASEIPLALAGDARKFRIENGAVIQE